MRGLITAAEWTNVDPHQYITNLVGYQRSNVFDRLPGPGDQNPDPVLIPFNF